MPLTLSTVLVYTNNKYFDQYLKSRKANRLREAVFFIYSLYHYNFSTFSTHPEKTINCLGKRIPPSPLPEHLNIHSYPNCVKWFLIFALFEFSRVFLYAWSRAFSIYADLLILQALSPKEQQTSGMRDVRCGYFRKQTKKQFPRYICVAWLN